MTDEPSYPKDAAVGAAAPPAPPAPPAPVAPVAPAAPAAPPAPAVPAPKPGESRRTKQVMAGAAIGIGSAAIVAALLYANRRGRGDKGNG